jgi:hypothetical protein
MQDLKSSEDLQKPSFLDAEIDAQIAHAELQQKAKASPDFGEL